MARQSLFRKSVFRKSGCAPKEQAEDQQVRDQKWRHQHGHDEERCSELSRLQSNMTALIKREEEVGGTLKVEQPHGRIRPGCALTERASGHDGEQASEKIAVRCRDRESSGQ